MSLFVSYQKGQSRHKFVECEKDAGRLIPVGVKTGGVRVVCNRISAVALGMVAYDGERRRMEIILTANMPFIPDIHKGIWSIIYGKSENADIVGIEHAMTVPINLSKGQQYYPI